MRLAMVPEWLLERPAELVLARRLRHHRHHHHLF
jgi:hypothetical protein